MKELIEKYDELYDEMASSKDPARMMAFGDAEKWVFKQLAVSHPELAEHWLVKLEASKWHNYLSEEEAKEIVESLEEKQGDTVVKRYEWEYDDWENALVGMGGEINNSPYYNSFALWTVMCMLFSDHSHTVNMFVQPPLRVKMYYHLALDKLMDPDRPHFVRSYFHLKE